MADDVAHSGTVADFLERLAARSPTPAGGSVAALCTAQAAALVAMVARYCDDDALVAQAEELVETAQRLVADDEEAFGAVAAAWRLPRGDEGRRTAVDAALVKAAEPQARVVEVAVEVLVLVDRLHTAARPGIAADLVAAAEVARAASTIARMNVTSNLRTVAASQARSELLRRIGVAEKGR